MYRVGQKTGPPCYIASNFRNTAQIYTIFFAEMKVVSFLTQKLNLLKLIMYNSGAIWRIRVTISNDARQ